MKLFVEIKSREELNTINSYGYVISVSSVSSSPFNITLDDALDILNNSNGKNIYLKLNLLYHDKDYPIVLDYVKKMYPMLTGIIFQDLGLVTLFEQNNIKLDLIYDPGTFNTVYEDTLFFKDTSISTISLSREISLSEIDAFLKNKKEMCYLYHAYGHMLMFYSLRKHFTNFRLHEESFPIIKDDYNVYLKEETRNEFYPAYEDKHGFFIYRDEVINIYKYIDHFDNIDYLMLDRPYISDSEYKDTISLYNGLIDYTEYKKKYPDQTDGYFFKVMGVKPR